MYVAFISKFFFFQADEQANLLLCIEGVLSSNNKIDQITSHQIFSILCTVSGLTSNNSIANKVSKNQVCYNKTLLFNNLLIFLFINTFKQLNIIYKQEVTIKYHILCNIIHTR